MPRPILNVPPLGAHGCLRLCFTLPDWQRYYLLLPLEERSLHCSNTAGPTLGWFCLFCWFGAAVFVLDKATMLCV